MNLRERTECGLLARARLDPYLKEGVCASPQIKWRDRKRFGPEDASELNALATEVPGWDTTSRRVGVSRTGFRSAVDLDVMLTPEDLLEAWR